LGFIASAETIVIFGSATKLPEQSTSKFKMKNIDYIKREIDK